MQGDPYLELAASLPRPTPEQCGNFAMYVAGAHSWYKHLPALPPGEPFFFFLDPNAGRVLTQTPNGALIYHDRAADAERFHYNEMPTAEYRKSFGHWQYHCGRGTSFHVGSAARGWDVLSTRLRVQDRRADWVGVTPDLVAAGACRLTALVHANFRHLGFQHDMAAQVERYRAWKAGNPEAPQIRVYEALIPERKDSPKFEEEDARLWKEPRPEVKKLAAGERLRQIEEMAATMERVLGLL